VLFSVTSFSPGSSSNKQNFYRFLCNHLRLAFQDALSLNIWRLLNGKGDGDSVMLSSLSRGISGAKQAAINKTLSN
jgi:hypothetical protein